MKYVDGYVLVVPKKNVAAYKKMAADAAKTWMRHGALQYMECKGEDMYPMSDPSCPNASFMTIAQAKKGETVWFSFIVYKSRKHRDAVNKKVMSDPAMLAVMKKYEKKAPFDMKRFSYGGFTAEVSK